MGNIHSFFDFKHTKSYKKHNSQLCEPEPTDSVKGLKYYLPNNFEDVDRQHIYHFFKRYVFQSNFMVPIEKELIQGGCKVLDVG